MLLPELVELNRIRLDEDRSFGDLATAIGLRDASTLNRLLRGKRQPTDRTLHKVRLFLDSRAAVPAHEPHGTESVGPVPRESVLEGSAK